MRARLPDRSGFAERDGVRLFYEVFGDGPDTIVFVPGFPILPSRMWRMNAAYLAEHFRVVVFDSRGNGRSDSPAEPEANSQETLARDVLAVMDATEADEAVLVGLSGGVPTVAIAAALAPSRVRGLVLTAHGALGPEDDLFDVVVRWDVTRENPEGLETFSRQGISEHYDAFRTAFWEALFPEPHSTMQFDDAWRWSEGAAIPTLCEYIPGLGAVDWDDLATRISCPVLVYHGDDDEYLAPMAAVTKLVDALGASVETIGGGGHATMLRDAVHANRAIADFTRQVSPWRPRRRRWTRAASRPKQVLFVATALGLGHVRRDVAVARELAGLHPDAEICWLATDPASRIIEAAGQSLHPASARLANETAHFESEAHDHDLHAFEAIRTMDETKLFNFMLFNDLTESEQFDLVVGDEAFEVDHHLHENPELKRFQFAFMTDFVGFLPVAGAGDRELAVVADHNAELVEQRQRFHRVRDASIFVGNPDDLPDLSLGDGLPTIPEFTSRWFGYSGYIVDPIEESRGELRRRLGFGEDELVCIVTCGGTAVGTALMQKVVKAFPAAKDLAPGLRMIAVCGPRIDRASLGAPDGVELLSFVGDMPAHLAACDLGVVQGGLATTMELAAAGTPFLYFPLAHHFEQQHFVRHRLGRYGAGTALDFDKTSSEEIARAIADHIGRPVNSRPVETDGAERAARIIGELL